MDAYDFLARLKDPIKQLLGLLAVVFVGVWCCGCGGSSNATSSTSKSASVSVTTSSSSSTVSAGKRSGSSTTHTSRETEAGAAKNISTFGHAATGAEKRAITALVRAYYAAAAADDGAKACSMIYSIFEEAIPEDYGQPPGPPELRGTTCAVVLSKLFRHVPGQPPSVLAKTEVTGVRLRGRVGYAQLRSSAMPAGEIGLEREHSSWKLSSLIGSSCTECAARGHAG